VGGSVGSSWLKLKPSVRCVRVGGSDSNGSSKELSNERWVTVCGSEQRDLLSLRCVSVDGSEWSKFLPRNK
jgi:hypothetical protein